MGLVDLEFTFDQANINNIVSIKDKITEIEDLSKHMKMFD